MSALRTIGLTSLAAAAFVTVTINAAPDHTTAGTPALAYADCHEEDGSGPQVFPCFWSGGANGKGRTYVLNSRSAQRPRLPSPMRSMFAAWSIRWPASVMTSNR